MGVVHDFTKATDWYVAYACRKCDGLLDEKEYRYSRGVCPRCGHVHIDWTQLCDADKISARKIGYYKYVTRWWFWEFAKLVTVEIERKQAERLHLPPLEQMYFWTNVMRKKQARESAKQAEAN